MQATYEVQCHHCKGKGKIEIAREVWVNWQICDRVLPRYDALTPNEQGECMAILGGSNLLLIQQGRHIFNIDQLYQLSELFNCKVADLLP